MKLFHTNRLPAAGLAFGLSTVLVVGIAFAATSSPTSSGFSVQPTSHLVSTVEKVATSPSTTVPSQSSTFTSITPSGSGSMMSEMLANLSPQERVQFQSLYPKMLSFMASTGMAGKGTMSGSMMGS